MSYNDWGSMMQTPTGGLRPHDAHDAGTHAVTENSGEGSVSWYAPSRFMVEVRSYVARDAEDAGLTTAYADLRAGATPNRFLPLDYAELVVAHIVDNAAHEVGTFACLTAVQRAELVMLYLDEFGTAYLAEFELAECAR